MPDTPPFPTASFALVPTRLFALVICPETPVVPLAKVTAPAPAAPVTVLVQLEVVTRKLPLGSVVMLFDPPPTASPAELPVSALISAPVVLLNRYTAPAPAA